MLAEPTRPSATATPAITSSVPPSTLVSPSFKDDRYQPCDDHRLSHIETPAAALTSSSHTPSLHPDTQQTPYMSSHRRANTEIIRPRNPRPTSAQLFGNQAQSFEDLDYTRTRPIPSNDSFARKKLEVGAKLLTDLFQGKSEQANLGLLHRQEDQKSLETGPTSMEDSSIQEPYAPSYTSRTFTSRPQKRMTAPSPLKQVTSSNPLSFFGLRRQGENRQVLPEPAEDELLNLDIGAALFPPSSNNPNGQEAFDDLRTNAENVIQRLQAAYKQRTFALHEVINEKTEKQEELEETKTRIGHLKIQLDGMAEKVLRQDMAMKAMAEELEQERQMRRKEEEARQRSVMLVKSSADDESVSDISVELQAPQWNTKRQSNGTLPSDSGFESGDESVAESVFSRRDGAETPTSIVPASSNVSQVNLPVPQSTTLQANQKEPKPTSAPLARSSAYDRVMKGLASSGITNAWAGNPSKCKICYGVPSSEAWSVMGVLKEENKGLKIRLGELEMVIDDCLSIVGP
ncbi:uncharacterized protein APUU_80157A [Aspergillus puulaauensis]|uniref:Uncharacterized protein n=1 Tax=Aspergillus puulaauensis TaxID=1220207 RepID=A0A7R7XYH1_9EURO|nr:uncharacterized protein APUU_80157A [Aspergillus puulaauensis]BCS29854.1 hypothetical protein APUU_80157A [Aspergillus puulaauensis]